MNWEGSICTSWMVSKDLLTGSLAFEVPSELLALSLAGLISVLSAEI